jgi:DNA invertase Pin-like site-specific DNA recombinase
MFALYLRQSQDTTGKGVAIERQRTECEAYAQTHGITLGRECEASAKDHEYVDNDRSASSGVREDYQRLLADIEAGHVTGVLTWDLDRLHRQPRELEAFIDLADARHIRLATVTGEADLSTDNGRLFARIKGAVGRAESERKAARQKAANRQLAAKGDLQPKERPFGWAKTSEGKRPVYNELHPIEGPAIKAAVDAILRGSESALSVYSRWNDEGLLTTRGNRWDSNKFALMLLRPRNAGLSVYEGVTTQATCDPIITIEDLAELKVQTSTRTRTTHGLRVHPFSALPQCWCGKSMYWRAGSYECAPHNAISATILDPIIWHALRYKVAEITPDATVAGILDQITAVRARLAKLDAQDDEVLASNVSRKARVTLLIETKIERDALEGTLDMLGSQNRLARLLDGITANPPGRISFDRHAEIGTRLKELPVRDLYEVASAVLKVVIHPALVSRKRTPAAQIVRRIEIDGARLGEDVDPYEGV